MPGLDSAVAAAWVDRWERQQQRYLPDREARFTALIDAVEAAAGREDPVVLDLGCGPGSLAARLLDRLPMATVVAIDADPTLLAMGAAVHGGRTGLRFADLDLRKPGWGAETGIAGPADAAVSTTALHWPTEAELLVLYAEVASVLRPGGLLLNGDHLIVDEPRLAGLDRSLIEAQHRRVAADAGETWSQWWEAAAADPMLAEVNAERERRWASAAKHGTEGGRLAAHVAALRAAGFSEIGTLWQYGENRLLCAFAPG